MTGEDSAGTASIGTGAAVGGLAGIGGWISLCAATLRAEAATGIAAKGSAMAAIIPFSRNRPSRSNCTAIVILLPCFADPAAEDKVPVRVLAASPAQSNARNRSQRMTAG
jgi:hypothetical protein